MNALSLLLASALALVASDTASKLAITDAFFEDPDRRVVRNLTLNAGESNYLSFRITGFKTDAKQRVSLTWSVECLDPNGVRVVEPFADKIDEILSLQDKDWSPKLNWQAVIPVYAPSGDYEVRIAAEDKIGKEKAAFAAKFRVRGEALAPEDKLAVRQFAFADSEFGAAKAEAVFKPGSVLWARFKTVGFKLGPEKEYWVEHDLSVLNDEGKVLFTNPGAAVEKHFNYYPPKVLSTTFNLNLQTSVKPGEYAIRLNLRDKIGEQTITHEAKFRVE